MTPTELAKRHPRLFHLTAAGAANAILQGGRLTVRDIARRWELSEEHANKLISGRRQKDEEFFHPLHGTVRISNNAPLSETKLSKVLDDGLTPTQWLEKLNSRVFFFTSEAQVRTLAASKVNRNQSKDVLVVNTKRLAEAYLDAMEICPINSGNTLHDAARRGHATFAPLRGTSFTLWQYRRGNKTPDVIREVCVSRSIPDIADYVIDVHEAAS